jgi:hypothetical protein
MPVNTASLKTFAPAMRRQLLEAVGRKLDLLLHSQTPDTLSTYAKPIAELREQEAENREQLLERVAYTWFNRLCALRYLDARGWHPFGCKVLMPAGEGETQPELLKLMRAGSLPGALKGHTNENRLHGLLDGQIQTAIPGADSQGEVYRELVLATCRFYHELLPNLFEGLDDGSELLLPDDLLSESSIAGSFCGEISDDDCQDVEILSWLYQFYIAEKKDEVMARKKAVPTEDIPAVTQLFTPHWIVRYLVENSLGRLWLLNRPVSKLREQMPYYVEGEAETDFLKINKPEDIKLLDPACGSGHMLTYAFDLLSLIYEDEGYSPSEIPGLILQHNLYGLEICPRAAQLAELALVFKAREKSRRFFQTEQLVRPNILELQNVQLEGDELYTYTVALGLGELFDQGLFKLLRQFEDAKTFGSLIQPCLDEQAIIAARRATEAKDLGSQMFLRETHLKVLRVLEQAEALTQRYHVVVANPPYMGGGAMNARLKVFAKEFYPDSKADLFAMFIDRNTMLSLSQGLLSMVTMQAWMFLSSFEHLRKRLVDKSPPITLIQIGYNSFPEMNSKIAQACAFVLYNSSSGMVGRYLDLNNVSQSADKEQVFLGKLAKRDLYAVAAASFGKIPGSPIAYWVGEKVLRLFETCQPLGKHVNARVGMMTSDNDRFLRLWWEVGLVNTCYSAFTSLEAQESQRTWFPHNKGGAFRKWAGNRDYLVDWGNNGQRIKALVLEKYPYLNGNPNFVVHDDGFYFLPLISWSEITSAASSFRAYPSGFTSNIKGMMAFPSPGCSEEQILALCNSAFTAYVTKILNPSVSFGVGDFKSIPAALLDHQIISPIIGELVTMANADWDNFETSWDFTDLPLLRAVVKGLSLEASWKNWEAQCNSAIHRMQELESENNHLFIAAYGLEGELQPEVPEEQITLARAEARKDMAAFLSYATGCMMGRYSLDQPGLILADARDSQAAQIAAYEAKVGKPITEVQFQPDPDGIIPVLDGEWFEDDIVARTRDFLAVTFTESSVAENLRFIEDSLGKDVRKYFCSDFYKDHLQTYKKRPIYWLVQSPAGPSRGGFACLIYLHRYTKDTLNQVLNNYFRSYLQKLEARQAQLGLDQLNDSLPTRERTAARKEAEKITKVLKECQAWEQDALLPLAQQRIKLDLDDGVKVNYLKLQDVLAPIPGLAAKEE